MLRININISSDSESLVVCKTYNSRLISEILGEIEVYKLI